MSEVIYVTEILVGLGVAYVVALIYHNGRQEGNQNGWSAAWQRARKRYSRRHHKGNAAK
jgi:hypothetical protein